MSKYKPFVILGPGDAIREELEFYGWEQKDLAEILDVSEKHVSKLLNNKVPISFDVSCRLSGAFKQSAQFWLNLDTQYRLQLEDCVARQATAARALIYRYMPVRDMRKKGWLPKSQDELAPAVKEFWGREELGFDFMEDQAAACFRKNRTQNQFNPYFALTWLQAARNALAASDSKPPAFNPERLQRLAQAIPSYTTSCDGPKNFVQELRNCGVVFLCVPHLEKTYTDGATFWQGETPVLIYTCRYDRNDNFWFTVAHEIGHILRHRDEDSPVFIDSLDHIDKEDRRESEADADARQYLRIPEILRMFDEIKRISRKRVLECARILDLHPAIVVGALQHDARLGYQVLTDCKEPIREIFGQSMAGNLE
jgi:HTH-type transcriptional regulator/antitoxin HigA